MRQNNHRLYDYLALHDRMPKTKAGFRKKRQRTLDEMVAFVKSEAGDFPMLETEQQVQEFLNLYLRLTFSIDGWWRDRMVKLLIANKWDEVQTVEQWFKSYDSPF